MSLRWPLAACDVNHTDRAVNHRTSASQGRADFQKHRRHAAPRRRLLQRIGLHRAVAQTAVAELPRRAHALNHAASRNARVVIQRPGRRADPNLRPWLRQALSGIPAPPHTRRHTRAAFTWRTPSARRLSSSKQGLERRPIRHAPAGASRPGRRAARRLAQRAAGARIDRTVGANEQFRTRTQSRCHPANRAAFAGAGQRLCV